MSDRGGTSSCGDSTPDELAGRVENLQDELKRSQAALKSVQMNSYAEEYEKILEAKQSSDAKDTLLVISALKSGSIDAARQSVAAIRQMAKSANRSAFMTFIWPEEGGKVQAVVALTSDLVAKGLKAGDLIKPIAAALGGSGGGKPDFAQAAGKDAAQIPAALEAARKLAAEKLA